jgi:hypothetical protein
VSEPRLTIEEAYAEFQDTVDEDDRGDPEDFAEDAFYAGWDYGWQDAQEYFRTGGTFR